MNKKGQVWVETVIYTLIGLAVIGLLLAVAKPKIDQMKDRALIDQAVEAMEAINSKIYEVQRAPGNRRVVDLKIGKGTFIIDSENDKISWVIESSYEYSEAGANVSLGTMVVRTRESSPWEVTLEIPYGVDIMYDDEAEGIREFEAAPTSYPLNIYNAGSGDGNTVIELTVS
jgi:type II secretory pathway pseudopilin PulG